MGNGSYADGKFNMTVTADYALSPQRKAEWQARLIEASYALYDATDGRFRLGDIYMADEDWALRAADIVLHEAPGRSFATLGLFGRYGQAMHIFDDLRSPGGGAGILHEIGHHVFALGDEYTKELLDDTIDPDQNAPADPPLPPLDDGKARLRIADSLNDSADLDHATAMTFNGAQVQSRIVWQHGPNFLDTYGAFNGIALLDRVWYQRFATCNSADATVCVMDDHTVHSEFCTAANHDPTKVTRHSHLYDGKSCWEVLAETMQTRWGEVVTPPAPTAVPGQTAPDTPYFFDLLREFRVALVVDRSGSMAHDGKMAGARFGVEWWLRHASIHNGLVNPAAFKIGVLWYSSAPTVALPLTALSEGPDLDGVIETVNALQPSGWTNIRDALYEGRDMIEADPGRAAIQAIILITDGVHNRPLGSAAQEALPALQAAGIQVFTLALGDAQSVDIGLLEELAAETGGAALVSSVGLDGFALPGAIGSDFGFLLQRLLGAVGLDTVETVDAAPPNLTVFDRFRPFLDRGERPDPEEITAYLGLDAFPDLAGHPLAAAGRVLVEKGAEALSGQLFHGPQGKAWLYLIDPSGAPADVGATRGFGVAGLGEALRVTTPAPGRWTLVALRATPGPAMTTRLIAGIENRRLVVAGDLTPEAPVGGVLRVEASATWGDRLSKLRATLRMVAPDGTIRTVSLSDDEPDEPCSGRYAGTIVADVPGRWHGEILIAGSKGAIRAAPLRRLLHGQAPTERRGVSLKLAAGAPSFLRRIAVHADVGGRPKPIDREAKERRPETERPSKRKLTPLDLTAAKRMLLRDARRRP